MVRNARASGMPNFDTGSFRSLNQCNQEKDCCEHFIGIFLVYSLIQTAGKVCDKVTNLPFSRLFTGPLRGEAGASFAYKAKK